MFNPIGKKNSPLVSSKNPLFFAETRTAPGRFEAAAEKLRHSETVSSFAMRSLTTSRS